MTVRREGKPLSGGPGPPGPGGQEADARQLETERALGVLTRGSLRMRGRMVWSSNATFLVDAELGQLRVPAVYKPRSGEAPLWDYTEGTLCQRETAAFMLSQALGWHLVPPTALRDGPLGYGAVQLYVSHEPDMHFLVMPHPDIDAVRKIVAFDVACNNGDRKSGHILQAPDGSLWAIDHGLCFHVKPKLRTVIWTLAGEPLPDALRADLDAVARRLSDGTSAVRRALGPLLSREEVRALLDRIGGLVRAGATPAPDPTRRVVPWPPV